MDFMSPEIDSCSSWTCVDILPDCFLSLLSPWTHCDCKEVKIKLLQIESPANNGEKQCLILPSAFGVDFLKVPWWDEKALPFRLQILQSRLASQRSHTSRLFVLGKLTTQKASPPLKKIKKKTPNHSGFSKFPAFRLGSRAIKCLVTFRKGKCRGTGPLDWF